MNFRRGGEQPDTRCRGWRKAGTGCGEDWERGRRRVGDGETGRGMEGGMNKAERIGHGA